MTIDAMPKMSAEERAERRRKQAELAAELKTTGALDEVFGLFTFEGVGGV